MQSADTKGVATVGESVDKRATGASRAMAELETTTTAAVVPLAEVMMMRI